MSSFNSCYRELKRFAGFSPSHAWIYLHWCVEAYARLTGEPFMEIFSELEKEFRFKREIRRNWPDSNQMLQAADKLNTKRKAFLEHYNALIEERTQQKKQGKRHGMNPELVSITQKQRALIIPEVGIYGWRKVRNQNAK